MALHKRTLYQHQTTNLSDDVICHHILPRLPCKLLSRFKVTSKAYHALIAPKTYFATLQSLSPSPCSTGFICVNGRNLSFLAEQDDIGVPDPSLKFMVKSLQDVKLLASANGLLLFYLFGEVNSLCICNPATMEKKILPKEEPEENITKEMGLVFNPHVSLDKYAVVDPLFKTSSAGIEYTFNVYSSQTGKWACSNQKVSMPCSRNALSNPVYALGLVYWSCVDYLLWFDPEKDSAGTILLPYNYGSARQLVEAFKDELACMCITSKGDVEVWKLIGGTKWNRLYELSSDTLIHEISRDHCFCPLSDEIGTRSILTDFATPVAFDGKSMYLSVNMKDWHRLRKNRLVSNKRISFDEDVLYFMDRVDDDYFYSDSESDANDDCEDNLEELLCCDMLIGKLINTSMSVIRTNRNFRVFHYHNSMVSVPPISK
ncbi:hypothetical protein LUZ62_017851 [Rhynchospora pubera]|uniref:F-box associated beta-propeller type 1 domain-containing protein n=1 Tax=Rhynchospora pubera TaxID=906938 RepID=A0AAV8GLY7_9POAL|nr:hypothetical protein LUZ62_017851 [Rhynchospora pubera]